MESPKDNLQLAIETTGKTGSLAVLRGETVLNQVVLDPHRRSAAALAPALDCLLRWCEEQTGPPEFISVAIGPGSFTGLRIGVTTAKSLGYALQIPLVPVDSLAAIAASAFSDHPTVHRILIALDAYRGQVFAGQFHRSELLWELLPRRSEQQSSNSDAQSHRPASNPAEHWSTIPETVQVLERDQWRVQQSTLSDEIAVAGDAKPFGEYSDVRLTRSCDAIGVGLLGLRGAILGQTIDPLTLVPRYLKPSAAEEKLG